MNQYNDRNNLSSLMQVRWKTRAEGRRHERVELIELLLIITYGVTGERYDEGVSINISDSGTAFETEADLSAGSLVRLVFGVNHEAEYRRDARILYRLGSRYGAYFTKPD